MQDFYIFNSLTQKKEKFTPITNNNVGMYTCGPTIYAFPTIGNWRTYTLADVVSRALTYLGYDVKHVMNLTDVGHLSGDNLGDASQGEDRIGKAAENAGVNAWAIASKYEVDFLSSFNDLNILMPAVICKATDHINEQIELIKKIELKGYTYQISDGIYFDVKKYEQDGNVYGELSNIDQIRVEGARINPNEEKRDPRDFALWKFFATGQKRHDMQWQSPWGEGFPGWHIECSAMSMKYLGDQFDLHLGGEDLKGTHHPNEIAQSECATGHRPFVKYWVHGAFLQVDGGRMGKSLGNAYTIHDVVERGFDPIALRYFYLSGKYSAKINFTWESLQSAQNSYHKIVEKVASMIAKQSEENDLGKVGEVSVTDSDMDIGLGFKQKFDDAICDDLNMPIALSVLWDLLKDEKVGEIQKIKLITDFDKVLGLKIVESAKDLNSQKNNNENLNPEIQQLIKSRESARASKDWKLADEIREQLIKLGIKVEDH